jgi:segregation and condensation protein B
VSTQDTPEHAPGSAGTDQGAPGGPEEAPAAAAPTQGALTASAGLPGPVTGAEEADEHAGEEPDGTQDDPDEPEDGLGAPTLDAALEAVLLVTDQPLDVATLAVLVRRPADEVLGRLRALSDEYAESRRGFDLREAAGGWRFYTRAECAQVVERYVRDGQQARLTQAALETLAVVAYRQPVSRARISAVRGVNVDGVMRTLTTRGLVAEAGHDESSGAILYRTTDLFLERLGLTSLDELPPVADYLPDIEMLAEFIEQTSS